MSIITRYFASVVVVFLMAPGATAACGSLFVAAASLNGTNAGLPPYWIPRPSGVTFLVPPGLTYKLQSNTPAPIAVVRWLELN